MSQLYFQVVLPSKHWLRDSILSLIRYVSHDTYILLGENCTFPETAPHVYSLYLPVNSIHGTRRKNEQKLPQFVRTKFSPIHSNKSLPDSFESAERIETREIQSTPAQTHPDGVNVTALSV